MFKKSHYRTYLAVAVALAGVAHAAALSPDDTSVKENLCLWLRSPDVNFDPDAGIWADISGRGNDAEAMGYMAVWDSTYFAPTPSFGSNPAVFNHAFGTVKFSGDVDDLMRAANINGGEGLSRLTIVAVYKLYNQDQSGAGMTRPVGIGCFTGEGANLGDYFNLANDVSIRKDNGSIQGATAPHPDDEFFIRVARMNPDSVDQWFNTDGTIQHIHNVTGVSYITSVDNFYLGDLRADNSAGGPSGYSRSDIEIAEVVVYNTDLTEAQIDGISQWLQANLRMERRTAFAPQPEDGALISDTWVMLRWEPGVFAASHNVYIGDDFDLVNEAAPNDADIFVGSTASTFQTVGFPGFPYPNGLVPGTTYYWRIDEVNAADPNSPWKGEIWSFSVPPKTAYNPDPADGAEFVDPNTTLSWTPGFDAKLHTVYISTDFDNVNNAAGGLPQGAATYAPGPLESEKVYYWRVDEFDAVTTHKGDIWSFTTPGAAGNPQPANGAMDVQMNATLNWTAATTAVSHDVYFGTDKDAVKNATKTSPEYKGNKALGSESYDPGKLAWHTTCYWRVDAVYSTGPVKGLVWAFTTADFILVDDAESYNDIDPPDPNSNRIFDKWIDGFGTTDNGALVGNDLPPYTEQNIVHGGGQSLVYRYDNNLKTSEATLTLVYPRDWTEEGVAKLSLWFRGAAANSGERMFVALNGNVVVYHDNPAATQMSRWTEWVIDLQAFADQGVVLTNVNTITIGIGTKNSLAAGGTGTMYFDDIRLYQ
ncbi:MAG: hypothetical protein ABIF19_00245 [Planctomycetota bacterium]